MRSKKSQESQNDNEPSHFFRSNYGTRTLKTRPRDKMRIRKSSRNTQFSVNVSLHVGSFPPQVSFIRSQRNMLLSYTPLILPWNKRRTEKDGGEWMEQMRDEWRTLWVAMLLQTDTYILQVIGWKYERFIWICVKGDSNVGKCVASCNRGGWKATRNSREGWRERERKSGAGVKVISLVGWR